MDCGYNNGWMDGQTEILPILQDFVPYQGCCSATLLDCLKSKKQGKGTADLIMPFGNWFSLSLRKTPQPKILRKPQNPNSNH